MLLALNGTEGLISLDHWLATKPWRTFTIPISQMLDGSVLAVSTSTASKVGPLRSIPSGWACPVSCL